MSGSSTVTIVDAERLDCIQRRAQSHDSFYLCHKCRQTVKRVREKNLPRPSLLSAPHDQHKISRREAFGWPPLAAGLLDGAVHSGGVEDAGLVAAVDDAEYLRRCATEGDRICIGIDNGGGTTGGGISAHRD